MRSFSDTEIVLKTKKHGLRAWAKKVKTIHYGAAAALSVAVLMAGFVHKGDDGPFGPPLELHTAEQLTTAPTYDQYEIVYFGATDCIECTTWRKGHLPLWERHVMSTQVQLTLKSANCTDGDTYAKACTATFETTDKLPAFALVDHETGEVMSTSAGIDGFYDLVRETGDVLDEGDNTGV